MSSSLKHKTTLGIFWSFLERIGQQGIQLIISIILARLFLPEQFGLIAMLVFFMAIARSFVDSGFTQALIQKKDATYTDECSIFYFNIVVGIVAAGLLCLTATDCFFLPNTRTRTINSLPIAQPGFQRLRYCTPGAMVGSNVKTGPRCIIGMNASIFYGVELPPDKIVFNNTAVQK